jgi:hypothetical protein
MRQGKFCFDYCFDSSRRQNRTGKRENLFRQRKVPSRQGGEGTATIHQ